MLSLAAKTPTTNINPSTQSLGNHKESPAAVESPFPKFEDVGAIAVRPVLAHERPMLLQPGHRWETPEEYRQSILAAQRVEGQLGYRKLSDDPVVRRTAAPSMVQPMPQQYPLTELAHIPEDHIHHPVAGN